MIDGLKEFRNIRKPLTIFVFSALWVWISYGFCFVSGMHQRDATALYEDFYLVTERPLSGVIKHFFNGGFLSTWLDGIWTAIIMAGVIFLTIEALELKKRLSWFCTAGLMVTPYCLIYSSHLAGDLYELCVALLFAVFAVFCLYKSDRHMVVFGILASLSITLSTAVYQSYATIVPGFLIIFVVRYAYRGKEILFVIKKAVYYIGVFIIGLLGYYALLKLSIMQTGQHMTDYFGKNRMEHLSRFGDTYKQIPSAYGNMFKRYITGGVVDYPDFFLFMARLLIFMGCLCGIILMMRSWRCLKKRNIIMIAIGCFLFPMAINFIYVLTGGALTHMQVYAHIIGLLVVVPMAEALQESRKTSIVILRSATMVAIIVFLWFKLIVANAFCLSQVHEADLARDFSNRLLVRIESMDGFARDKEIVFVGAPIQDSYFTSLPYADAEVLRGLEVNPAHPIFLSLYVEMIMKSVMNSPLQMSHYDNVAQLADERGLSEEDKALLENLRYYPESGIIMMGDTIYVRFPDYGIMEQ